MRYVSFRRVNLNLRNEIILQSLIPLNTILKMIKYTKKNFQEILYDS